MNKTTLKVPFGIQYISEWEDYEYPLGRCIVDKGVTGCGYTEYCLRNNLDIVLCSPRKLLLKNKAAQHKKDGNWNVLYLENDIENYKDKATFKDRIFEHIMKCRGANENGETRPVKFLITYDSLYHLVESLISLELDRDKGVYLNSFHFVVDEFQSIFLDAFFKASTEFNFVEYLQACTNILYLSATPMLDEYLIEVDEFKDLDFYSLDWSETGYVENVKVQRKIIKSISGECIGIVKQFQAGNYPTILDHSGIPIESKEAVFYLNSVSDIIRVIKKTNLKPSEVNIICADTQENKNKLNKLSKDLGYDTTNGFKIGEVPLKGELNKKYTFCTKSVYIGADFYSKCASSYIFADPNIKCLALDISLDLPQIVGRQRDKSNPFKNNIILYYKLIDGGNKLSYEKFLETETARIRSTNIVLEGFNNMTKEQQKEYSIKLKSDIQVSQYARDFVGISSKTGLPVYNKFIELANRRAWKVSQVDYQDSINVTKAIFDLNYGVSTELPIELNYILQKFSYEFDNTNLFPEKLKIYCDYMDLYSGDLRLIEMIKFYVKDPDFQKFYDFYGTQGCKAKKYRRLDLENGFKDTVKNDPEIIKSLFVVGEKYTKKDIKSKLILLYNQLGILKSPKATDIESYFEVKSVLISNPSTGKRDKGYLIVKEL